MNDKIIQEILRLRLSNKKRKNVPMIPLNDSLPLPLECERIMKAPFHLACFSVLTLEGTWNYHPPLWDWTPRQPPSLELLLESWAFPILNFSLIPPLPCIICEYVFPCSFEVTKKKMFGVIFLLQYKFHLNTQRGIVG